MHGFTCLMPVAPQGCRIGASGLYLCARCAISLQSRWDGLCSSSCLLCLLAWAELLDPQPRFNNLLAITASPLDRQQSSPVRANSNDHGHSVHWEWMKISIPSLADTHRKIAAFLLPASGSSVRLPVADAIGRQGPGRFAPPAGCGCRMPT